MRASIQGLGWFVRRTNNGEKLGAFYRDVLGLPLLRGANGVFMFWAGESSVIEVNTGGVPNPVYTDRMQSPCTPIFRVHGFDGIVARLQAAGVTFINDITREYNRLTYFLDPEGNITGLQERNRLSPRAEDHEAWRRWDAGETTMEGAGPMPPDIQHIGWVLLPVVDQPKVLAFYRDIVGLDPIASSPRMLTLGDGVLLDVVAGGSLQPIPNDRTEVANAFIIRVHGIEDMVADLKRQGVHFVNEPFDIPGGRLAYFVDPEGHLVGLQERTAATDRAEDFEANRRWARR